MKVSTAAPLAATETVLLKQYKLIGAVIDAPWATRLDHKIARHVIDRYFAKVWKRSCQSELFGASDRCKADKYCRVTSKDFRPTPPRPASAIATTSRCLTSTGSRRPHQSGRSPAFRRPTSKTLSSILSLSALSFKKRSQTPASHA